MRGNSNGKQLKRSRLEKKQTMKRESHLLFGRFQDKGKELSCV